MKKDKTRQRILQKMPNFTYENIQMKIHLAGNETRTLHFFQHCTSTIIMIWLRSFPTIRKRKMG